MILLDTNVLSEFMHPRPLARAETSLLELRTGQQHMGTHHENNPMRREQAEAVDKTLAYYRSIWTENPAAAAVARNPEVVPMVAGRFIGLTTSTGRA